MEFGFRIEKILIFVLPFVYWYTCDFLLGIAVLDMFAKVLLRIMFLLVCPPLVVNFIKTCLESQFELLLQTKT